jgi:hypothetical protein
MPEDDESFYEDTAEKEESIEEEMDNDEISPGEEGFLQGYNETEDKDKEEEKKSVEETEE